MQSTKVLKKASYISKRENEVIECDDEVTGQKYEFDFLSTFCPH